MSQPYAAIGNYSDGSTNDVTATANWSSSAPGVASVSSSGVAQASSEGSTTIKADVGPISGTQTLKVSRLLLIRVAPTLNLMRVGGVQEYKAIGYFRNGAVAPITTQVSWSSTSPGVATVDSQGVVVAQSRGAAGFFARFGRTITLPGLLIVV
jgi:hypothetical protein